MDFVSVLSAHSIFVYMTLLPSIPYFRSRQHSRQIFPMVCSSDIPSTYPSDPWIHCVMHFLLANQCWKSGQFVFLTENLKVLVESLGVVSLTWPIENVRVFWDFSRHLGLIFRSSRPECTKERRGRLFWPLRTVYCRSRLQPTLYKSRDEDSPLWWAEPRRSDTVYSPLRSGQSWNWHCIQSASLG